MTTVIIGAGIAGLGAARMLADHGDDVVVVESKARVGGRLRTEPLGGATVDLGAAWIHGIDDNPLTDLAHRSGVSGMPTSFPDEPEGLLASTSSGDRIDPVMFARGASAFWVTVEDAAEATDRKASSTSACVNGVSTAEQLGYRWAREVGLTSLEAADLEDLGLDAFDYEDRPGAHQLLTDGGYERLVATLAAGLDIRLEHTVYRVSAVPDGHIVAGPWGHLHAQRVIVTVSVGVLQARVIEFEPQLPLDVETAIAAIGMGEAEKLAVAFEHAPWSPDCGTLAVADTDADDPFANWTLHKNAPIAVSYGGGRRARALAAMSDDEALHRGLGRLETVFGPLPAVTGWTRSAWTHDPHTRGAYSYNPSTAARLARRRLGEPVRPGLRFAGEALSFHDYGTAHSALLSGRSAAALMIDGLE